jgi:hypothetical protein
MAKARTEIIRWATDRGWRHHLTNGGHICFTKGRHKVFTASTGGKGRGYRNTKGLIKRLDRQDEMEGAPT